MTINLAHSSTLAHKFTPMHIPPLKICSPVSPSFLLSSLLLPLGPLSSLCSTSEARTPHGQSPHQTAGLCLGCSYRHSSLVV